MLAPASPCRCFCRGGASSKTCDSLRGKGRDCLQISQPCVYLHVFHVPIHVAAGLAARVRLPLVVELLALAEPHLHLHPSVPEIDGEGHQRQPVLGDLGAQLQDLALVHEQPPHPVGVAVEDVALFVGADVHAADKDLAVFHGAEGVLEVQRPGADGLDLRAAQLDARLVAVQDKIVVVCLAVRRRLLDPFLLRHGTVASFRPVVYVIIMIT